jgi:predicted esterase
MIEAWPAEPYLARGFQVAYLQSSRVECTNGYGWTRDYERSRSEIHGLLRQIAETHLIDETCIVAGGFSGGAMASIDFLCEGAFPLKGVIALCPARTGTESPEAIARAAREGTRVVLLEGERSGTVSDQEELMVRFREAGLPHLFLANPGIGHSIPLDMDRKLEEALDFILSPED